MPEVRRTTSRQAVATLVVVIGLMASSCAPRTAPRELVTLRPDEPIVSQLPPGTAPLTVGHSRYSDTFGDMEPLELLSLYTEGADAIVIAKVNKVVARFVDGGSWIESRATVDIEQALKLFSQRENLKTLDFTYPGGEIEVDGRSVRTDEMIFMTPGARYLIFLQRAQGGEPSLWGALRIRPDKKLVGLLENPPRTPLLGDMTLDQVLLEVRRLLAKRTGWLNVMLLDDSRLASAWDLHFVFPAAPSDPCEGGNGIRRTDAIPSGC